MGSTAFMELSSTAPYYDRNMLNWHGSELGRVGGILQLTLQPQNVDTLTTTAYMTVAAQLAQINQEYNVPVFLRYGHEMNGNSYTCML